MGIILFYGQLKNNPAVFSGEYSYDTTVEFIDFFRAWWLNTMWLFAIFISHIFLQASPFHIIVGVRGCASSYGSMYIINYLGIKEAITSVFPQCLTILPLLIWFSVINVEKRRKEQNGEKEGVSLKRSEALKLFLYSMVAAGAETAIFALLSRCLF